MFNLIGARKILRESRQTIDSAQSGVSENARVRRLLSAADAVRVFSTGYGLLHEWMPGFLPLLKAHDDSRCLAESQFREGLRRERRTISTLTLKVQGLCHLGRARGSDMFPNLKFKNATGNINGTRHMTRGIFLWFAYINDERVARIISHFPISFHSNRVDVLLRGLNLLHEGGGKGLRKSRSWNRQQATGESDECQNDQWVHDMLLFIVN